LFFFFVSFFLFVCFPSGLSVLGLVLAPVWSVVLGVGSYVCSQVLYDFDTPSQDKGRRSAFSPLIQLVFRALGSGALPTVAREKEFVFLAKQEGFLRLLLPLRLSALLFW
jgi:hypothetical protein